MANIQTLLAKIMSAIYGEEVRGAIHDSIEAINDEVETWTGLQDGTVTTQKMANSAVTTAKVADGAITRAKLNADVVDTTLAVSGAPADAKTTGDKVNELKTEMSTYVLLKAYNPYTVNDWTLGAFGVSAGGTGFINPSNHNAVSKMDITLNAGDIVGLSDYTEYVYMIWYYNGTTWTALSGSYLSNDITVNNTGTYAVLLKKAVSEDLSNLIAETVSLYRVKNYISENEIVKTIEMVNDAFTLETYINPLTANDWTVGVFEVSSGGTGYINTGNHNAISIMNYYINSNTTVGLTDYSTYTYYVWKYDESAQRWNNVSNGYETTNMTITENGNYAVMIKKQVSADMTNYVEEANALWSYFGNFITLAENCVDYNSIDPEAVSIIRSGESPFYGGKYCSEGDSITAYNGVPVSSMPSSDDYEGFHHSTDTVVKGYQYYACKKYNMSLNNYGVGGSTIIDRLSDILNRDYTDYDLISISFGVNDARTGVLLGNLGNPNDTTFDTTTFTGAYRTILNKIFTDNPLARVILMSPIQRHTINGFGIDTPNINGEYLYQFADRIKELSDMYNCKFCDCYNEAGFNQINIYEKTCDGVHPNNIGYVDMGSLFINIMEKF